MRRAALAILSTVAGVVLLLSFKPHQTPQPAAAPEPGEGGAADVPSGSRSGTFAGKTITTEYGPVQVAATLARGKMTGVRVLKTPTEHDRSRQIAETAVPQLTKAALSTQSARIDAVSGASYTSQGYIRSLQSALDKAGG